MCVFCFVTSNEGTKNDFFVRRKCRSHVQRTIVPPIRGDEGRGVLPRITTMPGGVVPRDQKGTYWSLGVPLPSWVTPIDFRTTSDRRAGPTAVPNNKQCSMTWMPRSFGPSRSSCWIYRVKMTRTKSTIQESLLLVRLLFSSKPLPSSTVSLYNRS